MNQNKFASKERIFLYGAFALIILFLSPMFFLGQDAHMRVHDNLDSNIAWYKVLRNSGELFGPVDAVIPQIINGLPRNAFGTEFSGIQWLHNLFDPMTAYSLSQALTRIIAFIGMYMLLKRHFIKDQDAYPITIGVSLAFALTPFWPSGMLSTLGQPLALWAFLNIRKREGSWKDWLTLTLLPLYSSFVLGFFFFLAAMGLLWLRDLAVKREINAKFLAGIMYMTLLFLLIEYRLVYSLVIPEAPTSRNEFVSSTLGFWHTIRLAIKNYFLGHTHVMTLHTLIIVPLSFIVIWFIARQGIWKQEKQFVRLFILNGVLSIWYAFWFFKGWEPLKEKVGLLNTFNFARFHFLRPMIIYMMFGSGAYILWKKGMAAKQLVKIFLILQIALLFLGNPELYYRVVHQPSFREFYAEEQFRDIKNYIGKPQSSYRVASIGIHPSISQYNGFYTLDTYNNFYPLSYKHQFRKIIAKELDKNKKEKRYFDTWGGRCYIFVAELGKKYDYRKDSKKKIHNLQLNTAVFKKMGGRYIMSAVPILNAEEDGLHFLKSFNSSYSAWKIYLYKVK
ncbi:hypothetical protein SAMN05443252_101421 [Bacillus sp. OV322]|uniref:DUF6044 family protein n=1 Tax=Bacillus sp. OV322 TaxID=1882764 RepID=UPI0008F13479|nr:DUF6044 family protein [Bacillus sp. OV322]SFC00739.1 hypothetical protein SAMN05443252_101421 [Bacillus sp. OV322]